MSLRDDLRSQGSTAAQITKLIGGGLTVVGALTGNRQLERAGFGALATGMIMDGDRLSPPIRALHSWRARSHDMLCRRVDMWLERGRWGQHPHYGHHHYGHHPSPRPHRGMGTPGFFGERKGR